MKSTGLIQPAEMVRAILEGRKTQLRVPVKPQPVWDGNCWSFGGMFFMSDEAMQDHLFHEVYGTKGTPLGSLYENYGDRIWVRETWGLFDTEPQDGPLMAHVFYRATEGNEHELRYQLWRSPVTMPRWASRILLEITDIQVERLRDISEEDAIAEGCQCGGIPASLTNRGAFAKFWDSQHLKKGVCKTCKGYGVVPSWAGSVDGGSLMQDSKDCPDCHGKETGFGWGLNPWRVAFERV